MDHVVKFEVPGKPVPWQRAGSHGKRRYTPRAVEDHQDAIRVAWIRAGRPQFGSRSVSMVVHFYLASTQRGDIDNYGKCILDSMNGALYDDDRQVVCLTLQKHRMAAEPRTTIETWDTEDRLPPD